MDAIEKRARELLAEGVRSAWPDDHGRRLVIDALLVDDLDFISARVAVKVLAAALTPPEGFALVPAGLLRMVAGCAYPVSADIDSRGYRWSEAYLDQVLPQVKAAVAADSPEVP